MRIILKRYSLFLILSVSLAMASGTASASVVPGDSLRVKWMDGKKYVLHKVDVKENWTSISRRYQVPVSNLMDANTGITDLKVGQIIHVPIIVPETPKSETASPAATTPVTAPEGTPVYYTVKHGETLYSVSKRFGMTVEEMRNLNRLESDQLREGQQLVVKLVGTTTPASATEKAPPSPQPAVQKAGNPAEIPQTEKQSGASATATTLTAASFEKPTKTVEPIRKASGGKTLVQVTETGVASWVPDGDINGDKYYGLHRSAPIGTIIKVTNRMNNQSVYVKIVGVLPDTGDNENVIIKVSQAVASKLNALDPLFRAELSYGLMQ